MDGEFKCQTCEKKFASKRNLRRHVRRIHENQTMHECGICEKKYTLQENLRRHIRHIHTKEAMHNCGICHKKFARKIHKQMHLRRCSLNVGKKLRGTKVDLDFTPNLHQSAFGGCFADWKIIFPEDYHCIDLKTLLSVSTLSMKDILVKHLHEHTGKLKFTMAIHVVFEQSTHPEVKTNPPIVLRTDPSTVYIASDLDMILRDMCEQLLTKINTYEGTGSGWVIDYVDRLDTNIASFL